MAEKRGCLVFEIVNEKRREVSVGATRDPIFQMTYVLRRRPPDSIQHWNFDDMSTLRSVGFDMGEKDARVFVEKYVRSIKTEGWKYLT